MTEWKSDTATLQLFVRRLRYFSTAVSDTQKLLATSGPYREPWSREYQQRAVEIYRMTLPDFYLARLASSFAKSADVIESNQTEGTMSESWRIVHSYFKSASTCIADVLQLTVLPSASDLSDTDTTTPAAVRFDLIASEVSQFGIKRQIDAADDAIRALSQPAHPQLTSEQLDLLARLARGELVVDLATAAGFSERSMYRALKQIWQLLGVANMRQGVTLAVENGWVDCGQT